MPQPGVSSGLIFWYNFNTPYAHMVPHCLLLLKEQPFLSVLCGFARQVRLFRCLPRYRAIYLSSGSPAGACPVDGLLRQEPRRQYEHEAESPEMLVLLPAGLCTAALVNTHKQLGRMEMRTLCLLQKSSQLIPSYPRTFCLALLSTGSLASIQVCALLLTL